MSFRFPQQKNRSEDIFWYISSTILNIVPLIPVLVSPFPALMCFYSIHDTLAETKVPEGKKAETGEKVEGKKKIEEIVVTGVRPKERKELAPNIEQTTTTITSKDIEDSTSDTVFGIIEELVPGTFLTEKGVMGFGIGASGTGQLNIRGIGGKPNTNVLINVDGRPDFMGLFGHPIPDSYTLDSVEKIEVINGSSSVLYGNAAMGGVVNIKTKKRTEEGFYGSFTPAGGSFYTQDYRIEQGGKEGKFDFYLTARYRETNGDRPNSDFYAQNYSLRMGYDINENFRLNFDNLALSDKWTNPGPTTAPLEDDWTKVLIRIGTSLDLENHFERTNGELKFYGSDGEHLFRDGFRSQDQIMGAYLFQNFDITENNTVTFGTDIKNFGGDARNRKTRADFGRHDVLEYAGFVVDEQTLWNKLKLSAGARVLSNNRFGKRLLPQGGVSYQILPELGLRASVSTGYRSPTVNELFFPFPASNTNLKPETSINYEVGLHHSPIKSLSYNMTFFIIAMDNSIITEGRPPNATRLNGGGSTNRGFEFGVKYSPPLDGLQLWANYSFLDADELTFAAPEHKIDAGIGYHYEGLRASLNTEYVHRLFGANFHRDRLPDYLLLDAKLSYKINKYFDPFIQIKNLTNKDYELEKDFPMPGTNIYGGLAFSW